MPPFKDQPLAAAAGHKTRQDVRNTGGPPDNSAYIYLVNLPHKVEVRHIDFDINLIACDITLWGNGSDSAVSV